MHYLRLDNMFLIRNIFQIETMKTKSTYLIDSIEEEKKMIHLREKNIFVHVSEISN